MEIDYTVSALMFPAIPLMMTMYSNRFHTLSGLIRKLHDQLTVEKSSSSARKSITCSQQQNKSFKVYNGFCCFWFLFNMTTVLLLYLGNLQVARFNFGLLSLYDCFNLFISTRNKTF